MPARGSAVRPAARSACEQCLLVSTPCDACETHAIQAVARSGHRLAEGSHLLDVLALVRVWPSAVPDLASSLRYYASQQRTIQRRITRGPLPAYARATCTDSTAHRTDGTRCGGIIRRAVPRPVPRLECWLALDNLDDLAGLDANQPIYRKSESTAPCTERSTCTEGTEHCTDGTHFAGIIWRAGP
jgi:hypothetical protein